VTDTPREPSRRSFMRRMTVATLGAMAARGVYDFLDEIVIAPERAEAAGTVRRFQEQYLVRNVEVILDNGVTLAIPPLHNDVFTATLSSKISWTTSALKNAQSRLEKALQTVEAPYTDNASGLTIVVGWGLGYFQASVPSTIWNAKMPADSALSTTSNKVCAVQDAVRFPSDPSSLVLERNHVMFKMRSDSAAILKSVESQLFDNPSSNAYIADLFDLTSKRIGFLGRGFGTGTQSIAKQMALAAGVPGASLIPDRSQLMMGFTSTQTAALGPDNIPSFETLPGVTDQFPAGYFASGCAMHLSHIFIDLASWYGSGGGGSYAGRVARMFSPDTAAPADSGVVTLANGPAQVATGDQVKAQASGQLIGHNSALQQATRLGSNVTDNYGRLRAKGTAVPLREDFNTVDNPFTWTAHPDVDVPLGPPWGRTDTAPPAAAGLHFVAFVPATSKFHAARSAMDGVLPNGTNLREVPYNLTDAQIGINGALHTSHRQNYLIPPRAHRSFPLVELMK
jgi:hypothetical protein